MACHETRKKDYVRLDERRKAREGDQDEKDRLNMTHQGSWDRVKKNDSSGVRRYI